MSDISEDNNKKEEIKLSLKLTALLDSSYNSKNEDDILFSSNFLLFNSYTITIPKTKRNKNENIFDSSNLNVKKKFISTDLLHRIEIKKSSVAALMSTTLLSVKEIMFMRSSTMHLYNNITFSGVQLHC